ncbi:hypothetical protein [Yoonia sp.]|uniref:hypothetical protein n=1 Tax=Yoonia sp. TaxID=2212373 RepID=UPI0035C861F0
MFYLLSFGVVAATISATQVQSQPLVCADHDQIVARLAKHFGETRQLLDLSRDQTMVEVFSSPDTGSWTITVTAPDGLTCLVAAGQAYQYLGEPLTRFLPVNG